LGKQLNNDETGLPLSRPFPLAHGPRASLFWFWQSCLSVKNNEQIFLSIPGATDRNQDTIKIGSLTQRSWRWSRLVEIKIPYRLARMTNFSFLSSISISLSW
jgi:hypothetical protein